MRARGIRLAQRRDPKRPVAPPTGVIVAAPLCLIAGTGELLPRVVAFADRGSQLFVQPLRRLPEVVAALGCSLQMSNRKSATGREPLIGLPRLEFGDRDGRPSGLTRGRSAANPRKSFLRGK